MSTPAVTEVSICSNALGKLGDDPITSLADDTDRARKCTQFYGPTRDAVLRAHPWNFALERVALAALVDAPVWEYDYAYQIPSDCLRVIKTDLDVYTPYKVEGRKILTSAVAPLYLQYIKRIEETSDFDAAFVDALTSRLAYELSNAITGKKRYAEEMWGEYTEKLKFARTTDGMEGSSESIDDHTLTDFRR